VAVILVVDDEVQVARSIDRVLVRHGYQVRTAHSAAEALGKLDGVDVLLTDLRMPGIDGLELVAAVKERHPAIRCGIMSGDAGARGMETAPPTVEGRLPKPFRNEDLLALIARLCGSPPPGDR
jgi:two-component system nitrogen regulation response regulator GlnG